MRRRTLLVTGCGVITGIALALLGGAAVTGQAATTQQVTAEITCEPATVQPGKTVGCVLTVSNEGGNNVNRVVVTDEAPGGKFLSSSSSLCTGLNTDKLSCDIGKLTAFGTAGSSFTETHELQVPSSGTSLVQSVTGRYSPNPNNRASDTIPSVTKTTTLDSSADFDGRFTNANAESVQTGGGISLSNPYTTGATVLGTTFSAGLSVREQYAAQNTVSYNLNCPNGCFGGQVIEFNITSLGSEADLPASFTLTATIAGQVIPNGKKAGDIVVRHNGFSVPLCSSGDTDPSGDCIVQKTIDPSTKIATIQAQGPGDGNGGWGFG